MFKSPLQNVQISAANIGNLSETKKDLADFFYIFKENLSITAFHRDGPEVNLDFRATVLEQYSIFMLKYRG